MTRKYLLIFLKYLLINGYVGMMVLWLQTEFAHRSLVLWLILHLILIVAVSVVCVLQEVKKWQLGKG